MFEFIFKGFDALQYQVGCLEFLSLWEKTTKHILKKEIRKRNSEKERKETQVLRRDFIARDENQEPVPFQNRF